MSCAICEIRKEKRFCPAIHGRICAQCCGTSREITLECPSECPYLRQAREHEKPRTLEQVDQSALFPQVDITERFIHENEQLLLGLSYAVAKAARANRIINDRDVISSLRSLAGSYETLVNSGLVYQAPNANIMQQAIAGEIQTMVSEFRELEQKHLGAVRLKDSDVLRAIVFLLRMAESRTSGRPKSRAYLDMLFSQMPDHQPLVPGQAPSGLIVP